MEKTRPSGQRCVLMNFWAYPLIKMFYINSKPSRLFLHLKLSILSIFRKSVTKRVTDRPTDGPTDGRTHPLIEMRGRI